ncbi:hypothetical protein [Deinococcus sp. YIM 77859]|uniref:hypothetical protein n=1 Tax=Deinococcus sp. YIM 77859 TaxID=1540221 RepID=UPI00054FDFD9|nr:hypothetical protein [Deinococcus sp. YIM 77859]
MSDHETRKQDTPQEAGTPTEHGRWTPEDAEAVKRELRELAQDGPGTRTATERVDKSQLSLPQEQRPTDH